MIAFLGCSCFVLTILFKYRVNRFYIVKGEFEMKMICPHCCGEQQYSIKVLIHPDCKNCGKNMTRSINKKFSRCKGIARCLALLPIGIGLFVQSTFWNILGLIISLIHFHFYRHIILPPLGTSAHANLPLANGLMLHIKFS